MFTERGRRKVCEGNLHGFPGQFLFKHSTNHCHHLNKALSRRRPALVCVLDFSLKLQAASIESRSFRVSCLRAGRQGSMHARGPSQLPTFPLKAIDFLKIRGKPSLYFAWFTLGSQSGSHFYLLGTRTSGFQGVQNLKFKFFLNPRGMSKSIFKETPHWS